MSPHAISLSDRDSSPSSSNGGDSASGFHETNGRHQYNSLLQPANDDELHDLVCIGFGPAGLAVAVALHDAMESRDPTLKNRQPKVRFLEKQDRFAWHAGMLLPGAKMQITFIKDLATLRNPRSEFTFINYLHEKGRLVDFTNLGTFLPSRIEYEDYMKWCSSWFGSVVSYSQAVQSVVPGPRDPKTGAVSQFTITSAHPRSGQTTTLTSKNIIIATGGSPNIPATIPYPHPRVLHSSQYATTLPNLSFSTPPRNIAVIGAGQSAAEVFSNLPSHFPSAQVSLLLRGSALRPSDDSPFVNEIFNPDRIDDIYAQSPTYRSQALAKDKATNYSVVRLELLEHIYTTLYNYKIRYGEDEREWPQRILPYREVLSAQTEGKDGKVRLRVQNGAGEYFVGQRGGSKGAKVVEDMDFDLIIVASGYRRDAHERILEGCEGLRNERCESWDVRRDYSVRFAEGKVARGSGVWLQGCNEKTHGLSDTLLSVLSVRGGEMVQNIFAQ